MLSARVENVGDVSVVECKGRIVRSEAAFKLRRAVTSQTGARVVVLDLTKVYAIEGGGLGMLWFLQNWAQTHDIQLKLFNPTNSVRQRLEHNRAMLRFDIAGLQELVPLLAEADSHSTMAA